MTKFQGNPSLEGRNAAMSGENAKRPVRVRFGLSAAMLTVLALASCGSPRDGINTGSVDDYRERHPIIVTEAEHSIEIPIASGDRSLSMGARDVIRGFGQKRMAAQRGVIQVLYPQGSPNSAAARTVREQVRAELRRAGIEPGMIVEQSYQAPGGESAPIRISYVATTAMVASTCGEWPKSISPDMANRQYHNFGCAYQNNLAAQIANPADLIGPRAQTPVDAEQRSAVMKNYREKFVELKDMN